MKAIQKIDLKVYRSKKLVLAKLVTKEEAFRAGYLSSSINHKELIGHENEPVYAVRMPNGYKTTMTVEAFEKTYELINLK